MKDNGNNHSGELEGAAKQPPRSKRKPARPHGSGAIFKPKGSRFFWIAYMSGGKRYYESTKSEIKQVAKDALQSRLGDVSKGIHVTPKVGKKTLGDGLKAVINDMTANGRKNVDHIQRQIDKHLIKYFRADTRMSHMTTSDITEYVAHRLKEGAAPASCNHELATVRRAFVLAVRGGELATRPHVPMLQLNNTRQGFFERPQFDAILEHAPAFLHAPLTFAFITGWRFKSEVMPLTVAQVDLVAGVVRLEPGETKNKEGRSFYMTDELRSVLQGQLDSIEKLQLQGVICPYIFHRPDGRQIKDFRALWKTACEKAGYPGKILHDFRRTAVRTLERSGVPRSTAMAMVGHKTESIYRRYAIVDEAMHREAAAKVNAYVNDLKARGDAERIGQVMRFEQKKGS